MANRKVKPVESKALALSLDKVKLLTVMQEFSGDHLRPPER
jgi:hypothetical protein